MSDEGRVHPDCRNASNPYHECSEFCFKVIAETKARMDQNQSESVQVSSGSGKSKLEAAQQEEDLDRPSETDEHAGDGDEPHVDEEENMEGDFTKFTGRKKKLWELRMIEDEYG
ncbi:uncharacterized protein LOC112189119 [Rosa chinensis]|uniref:uncharacterized protein LOC112189119 n=1 Tax=Rosa chinensis TaxID=74649 RepID=UPI000D09458E|nr:uncharacterized protein LOC112189119 [Rosa chinensis]